MSNPTYYKQPRRGIGCRRSGVVLGMDRAIKLLLHRRLVFVARVGPSKVDGRVKKKHILDYHVKRPQ